jgi:PAS domain S-box-containing protein
MEKAMVNSTTAKSGALSELDLLRNRIVVLESLIAHYKQTEKEQYEGAIRNRDVINHLNMAVAVYEVRENGGVFVFKEFNPVAEQIEQIKRQDVIGKNLIDIFPSAKEFGIIEVLKRVWKTGKPEYMPVSLYKDDRISSWRENYVSKLSSMEVMVLYNTVAEPEKLEEKISQSRNFQELVIDNADLIMFVADTNGNIITWNKTAEEITGYSRNSVIGNSKIWELLYPDKDYLDNTFKPKLLSLRKNKGIIKDEESLIVCKDKSVKIISWNGRNIFDSDGKSLGIVFIGRDVTNIREALERLRLEANLIANERDAVITLDDKAVITSWNNAAEEIYGWKAEEVIGKKTREVYKTQYQGMTPEEAKELIVNSGKHIGEVVQVSKSGELLIIDRKLKAIRGSNNQVLGFVTVNRDITEHKKMEQALQLTQYALDHVKYPVYWTDADGKISYVNDACCKSLGYTREELLSMNVVDFNPTATLGNRELRLKRIRENGSEKFETLHRKKDGRDVHVEININYLKYDSKEFYFTLAQDITQRKRLEKALLQAKEKYKVLVENINDVIFSTNSKGNIVYISPVIRQLTGYKPSEVMGKEFREFVHPDDSIGVEQSFINTQNNILDPYEFRIIHKDGSTVFVSSYSRPILVQNEVVGVTGVITDLSDRKKAETEKKELEKRAQVTSRLAAIGEMAAGIAHEINNPLTGIIGYAHLLMQSDIPADIKKDVEVIDHGAQRVASIVKRLLTFARQQPMEREYLNINRVVETALELQAYYLRTGNIKVVLQLEPNLPLTIADANQLQQVFLNIIVNAKIEMQELKGKGVLTIKTEKIDNVIKISFGDNGPGIAPENLEKIFQPFFTTRPIGKGTGLGLSICHGIIVEHSGKIYAENELNKGATFIIELPIIKKLDQQKKIKAEKETVKKTYKARILVMDDEPVVRQFLDRILTTAGHEVEVVDNAHDFMESVKNNRYNLILLDMKMPEISGIELYGQLEKIAKSLAHRVVFITGDVMGADTQKFLSKTKAPYILKPFDSAKLNREINRYLTGNLIDQESSNP